MKDKLQKRAASTQEQRAVPRQDVITDAPRGKSITLVAPFVLALLLLAYILYANQTAPSTSSSFHNIGGEKEFQSPFFRDGMRDINRTAIARNMSKSRAEFVIPVPYDLKALRVEARFSDSGLPIYLLGNQTNVAIYDPVLEELADQTLPTIINWEGQNISEYRQSATEPSALLIATSLPLHSTPSTPNLTIRPIVINAALQGEHRFLMYTKGQFDIRVLKRDINQQEGADPLTITITALNGTHYGDLTIPDDEEANMTRQVQQGTLSLNLTPGVYMLTIPAFDGVIKQLVLSTNKVVTHDINILNAGNTKPQTIYLSSLREGAYSISRLGGTTEDPILVDGVPLRREAVSLNEGNHAVTITDADVTISGTGWLSFSPESYFEPFIREFVPLTTTTVAIADRVWTDYTLARRSGSWLTNAVTLQASSIAAVDGRATISLYAPSRTSFSPDVSIDWVNVTVFT